MERNCGSLQRATAVSFCYATAAWEKELGGGGEKYTLIIFGTSGAPAQISRDFWSLVRRRVRK